MRRHRLTAIACLTLLALTAPLRADYVARTYLFDQSNRLPDGLVYGSMTIEAYDGTGASGGGLAAGQVRLTFQVDPIPVNGPSHDVGIRAVGFNSDLSLTDAQVSVPDGWGLRHNRHMGGFGVFGWQAFTKPADRQPLVTVLIDGLGSDANVDHFRIESRRTKGGLPPQGPVYFAARVGALLPDGDVERYFAHTIGTGVPPPIDGWPPEGSGGDGTGTSPSPEPSTLLLAALGCGGAALYRRLRTRSRHAQLFGGHS